MRKLLVAAAFTVATLAAPLVASAAPEGQRHGHRGHHGHGHRGPTIVVNTAYPVAYPVLAPVAVPVVYGLLPCWTYWYGYSVC